MSFKVAKFGAGPKELGGSVDLISHCRLWPHHDFFCKRSLPLSISETHYLKNVVGNRQIRKGDGMELDQLSQDFTLFQEKNGSIHPFHLDVLADVFHMREATTARLSSPEAHLSTKITKLVDKSKEKYHKKPGDEDRRKLKDQNEQNHQINDRDVKVKVRKRDMLQGNALDHSKSQEKKRRLTATE